MKKILSMLLVIILAISSQIFVVSAAPLTSEIVSKDNKESILFQNYLNNSNVDSLSVNKIRRLYDFAGNLYTLIECSPTGYVVFHNDSGRFIEEDFESPSPYIASSGKLYYGGPTEYYTKTDEKYEHTVLDESISLFYQTELSIQSTEMSNKLKSNKNDKVLSYLESNVTAIIDLELTATAVATTWNPTDYIPYSSYIRYCSSCGYMDGGVCGYIAANLVLYYWQRRYPTQWIIPTGWWSTSGLVGSYLTNHLVNIGASLGYGNSTWGLPIRNVLISYASQEGISCTAGYYLLGGYIWGEIDADRPVVVFGNIYLPDRGTYGNHAVTAYGYRTSTDGQYQCVANFGWSGTNYRHVYVDGTIGSITTFRLN